MFSKTAGTTGMGVAKEFSSSSAEESIMTAPSPLHLTPQPGTIAAGH